MLKMIQLITKEVRVFLALIKISKKRYLLLIYYCIFFFKTKTNNLNKRKPLIYVNQKNINKIDLN